MARPAAATWLALSAALLLQVALSACSVDAGIGCQAINATLAPYCSTYVTYNIANTTTQAVNDVVAQLQHSQSCEYYAYTPYACSKYFPRCVDATNTTAAYEVKICGDYCLAAANNKECASIFTTIGFTSECAQTAYYSAAGVVPPLCYNDLAISSSSNALAIKLGIGLSVGVLALVGIFFIWRRHKQENITPEALAVYDAKKAAKAAAKERKLKEANVKKETRNGRLYETPDLHSPGHDAEVPIMHDVELGVIAGGSSPTPASPASPTSPRKEGEEATTGSHATQSSRRPTNIAGAEARKAKKERKEKKAAKRASVATEPEHVLPAAAATANPDEDAWKSGRPIRVALG